jgi:hypothetical protein
VDFVIHGFYRIHLFYEFSFKKLDKKLPSHLVSDFVDSEFTETILIVS